MAKRQKRSVNWMSGLVGIIAVVIVGATAFQYQNSLITPSEAAFNIPPPSAQPPTITYQPIKNCQSAILATKTFYVSTYGSDTDLTPKGVRRGNRMYPYRTIRHALEVLPQYSSRRIIIMGEYYELDETIDGDDALGNNPLIVPAKAKVWITKDIGNVTVADWYHPESGHRPIRILNYGDQLLVENLHFDQLTLITENRGSGGYDKAFTCKFNIRGNHFISNQQPASDTLLVVSSATNEFIDYIGEHEYSSGRGSVTNNVIELYDVPSDIDSEHYVGLGIGVGGTTSLQAMNNKFIFPKYGTNTQNGGTEPREYYGIDAAAWNSSSVAIEKNIFTTREFNPDGETAGVFGIHTGTPNITIGVNDFSAFQGIPTLVE